MGRDHFMISATNPNERSGGGGCLCSPAKLADARGPYIVFTGVETDSAFSPYAVLCADCACNAACKAGVTQGVHGALSEPEPVDGVPQSDHDAALERLHATEAERNELLSDWAEAAPLMVAAQARIVELETQLAAARKAEKSAKIKKTAPAAPTVEAF